MIPIAVLGRLNAHARRRGGLWTNESKAIYAYKTLAALMLHEAGEVAVRFVHIKTSCNCDKGWWWYGMDEKCLCYRCDGKGVVTLRFSETTFRDGQVWHHPWEGHDPPGRLFKSDSIDAIDWQPTGDWEPRQPPVELPLPELIAGLNQAEDWIESVPESACYHRGIVKRAKDLLHLTKHRHIIGPPSSPYRLYIGKVLDACEVCGRNELVKYGNRHNANELFDWLSATCEEHKNAPWNKQAPAELLNIPGLDKWNARHSRVAEVEY